MNNESRPHFKPGAIKYTRGYGRKLFISKFINFIIILITLIIMGLTVFIYASQPVKTNQGFTQALPILKRMPEIGERIVVVETENYNMFTPLKRAVTNQNVYEAEIIAGPYGEIKQPHDNFAVVFADKTITVNVEVDLKNADDRYLDKEYIVRKIDKEGNYLNDLDTIIMKDEVLGLIKTNITNK